MVKIILATASPYRQEAFRSLDIEFIAEASDLDEYFEGRPDSPEELVLHLAKLKAEAVAKNYDSGIVIGFDSVGCFKGEILEKPKSREECFKRLSSLSGNSHQFFTGIFIMDVETGKVESRSVMTDVMIRNISESEINKYLDQDPRFDTYALGYDPLGHYSSTFVKSIEGSYNNLIRGIPLETIAEILVSMGLK